MKQMCGCEAFMRLRHSSQSLSLSLAKLDLLLRRSGVFFMIMQGNGAEP